ncbi:MAG: hypothetical protein A2539_05810 [Elusimicrobia bacterium RIFOXYD2_FULL_34_15]|nr:MAG: hypothetical protein A2539_05810 [Elusimicrobia bacterium RIFOXYD2_FULL_34_15]
MKNRILVVDDDKELRDEIRFCLEEYKVIEAGDGKEALRILRRANDIGLVLLDIRMPGMTGIELLEKIRETDQSIGIIILTGHGTKEVVIDILRKRANDYFEKPFNVCKLKESIERILSSKKDKNEIGAMNLEDRIKRAKKFISENCCKKINLKDVTEIVCLSNKYFSRMFKKITGKNFVQYKSEIKIKKAKEFLRKTSFNISQIAIKLGYNNAESFCRDFVKTTGCAPKNYRKKYIKKLS